MDPQCGRCVLYSISNKGMAWESPRGPMSIDNATGDVIHNIYIRKVERANGEINNVEFVTFKAVKDMRTSAK